MSIDLSDTDLDAILTEVGEFGAYQVLAYFLICIPCALSGAYISNYMIIANTLTYRCKVPECDTGENNRQIQYNQPWLANAIPSSNDKYDSCHRFAPIYGNQNAGGNQCTPDLFNTSRKIECTEYIYATDERNVQTEFNIHCSDSYKLALVGTISNVGRFMFFPLTGLLSDRFGRLTLVIFGTFINCIAGIIKSFSVNYVMYLILEFLEASAGTCTFGAIFILAIEWVSAKYRVVGSTIIAVSFPLGEILLGFVSMYIHDFRILIRVLYTPGLLVFLYFWIVPESLRWLLVTGRVDRAIKILKKTASANGKELSQQSIDLINLRYSPDSIAKKSNIENKSDDSSIFKSIYLILKSKKLCFRLFNCCYQWVACCFCYYGISLVATHVPGENRYTSFIFVVAVEVPGLLASLPLLSRLKRRILMFMAFAITAVSIIVTPFIPKENSTTVLILFMIGKASITFGFAVLYMFTAEQWPTNLRTTLMNFCSMIGRTGAMIAPLIAISANQNESLPQLLFGGVAILAAIFVLFSPETFKKKLPDTVQEAMYL